MMPVPVAPLAPELAPQEVGLFLQFRGMRPETAHAEELQAFLGRTLELLNIPPESTEQMRAQLRCWQRRLRWSTAGCRLTWAEAFALYGLQGDVGWKIEAVQWVFFCCGRACKKQRWPETERNGVVWLNRECLLHSFWFFSLVALCGTVGETYIKAEFVTVLHHVHSPKLVVTLPPNHSTLQWHPAMAPRPLPKVGRHLPPQPEHTTMAPCNGTQQWHHVHSPKVGSHPPHYNGTRRWHPAMAPHPLHPAMARWCHVQSAKVLRRPPPLLEVRTPRAIAIWGISIQQRDPQIR